MHKTTPLTDFLLLFLPVESCNKCQPGWVLLKSTCYYFSSQNKSDLRRNWFESRGNCVSQGGDLLVIDSAEEQVSQRTREEGWGGGGGFNSNKFKGSEVLGYQLPAGSCVR